MLITFPSTSLFFLVLAVILQLNNYRVSLADSTGLNRHGPVGRIRGNVGSLCRRCGGFLVRNLMDSINYERSEGKNVLRIEKKRSSVKGEHE